MKIENDKYYTPISIANDCWKDIEDIIGLDNITDIIEPSVGNGSFCNYKIKPNLCIDILPEVPEELGIENVIKDDFLEYQIAYKKGRLIIGNPPYGDKLSLALKFFRKAITISDYIGFVLPINQLNNSQSFYEFDLISSRPLGLQDYSGRQLDCCFNIYKRPRYGLNPKPYNKIDGVKFYRQDKVGYKDIIDYDVRMCYWGNGSAGKILDEQDKDYAGEYKIKVLDSCPNKEQIINILKTFDWKGYLNCISMKRLKQYQIIDVIKKELRKC